MTDHRKSGYGRHGPTDRSRALVAELQHRIRNLIAVVQALANETALSSGSIKDFSTRFSARLACLARAQTLLSRIDAGETPSIGDLVEGEIAALGAAAGDRIAFRGQPDLSLRSSAVQPLALALHELGANALQHGALSRRDGRLSVGWRSVSTGDDRSRTVEIEWIERTGAGMRAAKAMQDGYGRDLVEQALAFQAGADVTFEANRDGVRWVIVLPACDAAE